MNRILHLRMMVADLKAGIANAPDDWWRSLCEDAARAIRRLQRERGTLRRARHELAIARRGTRAAPVPRVVSGSLQYVAQCAYNQGLAEAREEILRLRAELAAEGEAARRDALMEAAGLCENIGTKGGVKSGENIWWDNSGLGCATAIRKLMLRVNAEGDR